MSEEPKKEESVTPEGDGSTPENKDQSQVEDTTQNNEGDEKIEVSKKDYETAIKKAEDFENMVKSKRLEKLNGKKETKEEIKQDNEELTKLMEEVKSIKEQLTSKELAERESNLKGAYQDFISSNKWADDEGVFTKISENFDGEGAYSKDQYLKKIEEAALKTAPEKYKEYLKNKAEKEALSNKFNLDNGGNSGGGSPDKSQVSKPNTGPSDLEKKFMDNMPPGFKASK